MLAIKRILKDYIIIITGSFFVASGLNMFLVPFRLSSGGIGTFGTILLYLFKIPLSITNLIFNAILFVLGYKFLGKGAVIKTVVGILSLSIFLEITTHFPVFKEDLLFCTVIGGIMDGIGMGLVVKVDGSTGGSDFACLIIKRFFPHIPIATTMLIMNCSIIALAGITFKSYMVSFYSAVALYISSKVTDWIMTIGDDAKTIYIISEKYLEIEQLIIENFKRSATEFYCKGAFSKEAKPTLLCVVKPKEAQRLIKESKKIDKNAFIIISDAREVLGEGFKK